MDRPARRWRKPCGFRRVYGLRASSTSRSSRTTATRSTDAAASSSPSCFQRRPARSSLLGSSADDRPRSSPRGDCAPDPRIRLDDQRDLRADSTRRPPGGTGDDQKMGRRRNRATALADRFSGRRRAGMGTTPRSAMKGRQMCPDGPLSTHSARSSSQRAVAAARAWIRGRG
jgi:hypothetical protein